MSDKLAAAIKKFQFLVRQSAKGALAGGGAAANTVSLINVDASKLYGLCQLIQVHFESRQRANLFRDSVIGSAMHQVDELMPLSHSSPVQIATAIANLKARSSPLTTSLLSSCVSTFCR